MNALAGGGTILTFPTLLLLGESARVANATSTVALLPGAAASLAGYRREVATHRRWLTTLLLPSLLGGGLGSLLLLVTPERTFARLAPWLVLFATALFAFQSLRSARRGDRTAPEPGSDGRLLHAWLAQFAVAVYGGYFGAGIGILMLAALGFMGFTNIHRMNGLKNWGGLCMNLVAAAAFAASGIVNWPVAVAMAGGAVLGGYGGSRLAQRVDQETVRRAVIAIGLAAGLWLLGSRDGPS